MDDTMMMPTRRKDTCWPQNLTSISTPRKRATISKPRVTGSIFPKDPKHKMTQGIGTRQHIHKNKKRRWKPL